MSAHYYTIGITPKTTGGICILNNDTNKIEIVQALPIENNILKIRKLQAVLARYAHSKVIAHIENIVLPTERLSELNRENRIKQYIDVGYVYGAIRSLLTFYSIDCRAFDREHWLKYYGLSVRSSKEAIRSMIMMKYPDSDLVADNTAEAILLARMNIV